MFFKLIPTFAEVTKEKLVVGAFLPPPLILNRVKATKTIVCSNILDSGNSCHIETTHLTRTANQLNGFYKIKGLTTWNFPTDLDSEY